MLDSCAQTQIFRLCVWIQLDDRLYDLAHVKYADHLKKGNEPVLHIQACLQVLVNTTTYMK